MMTPTTYAEVKYPTVDRRIELTIELALKKKDQSRVEVTQSWPPQPWHGPVNVEVVMRRASRRQDFID